jgi:anionic cell wall polymer biosynthesis LytR-Cps2A-Psr (LCP) family protein
MSSVYWIAVVMKNRQPSIDGFIPRRSGTTVNTVDDSSHNGLQTQEDAGLSRESIASAGHLTPSKEQGLSRQELDQTLQSIDNDEKKKKSSRKHPRNLRKIIKRTIIALLIIGLCAGGYVAAKVVLAGGHIFKGNIFDLIKSEPLKQDANGQTNILIVGTSEDDPGHEAGNLTDSIMIISLNQEKKTATMFSLPRDLEVQYGQACVTTGAIAGKINAYFMCSNADETETAENQRQEAARKFFGGIVGLDIQYSARVNYTVMRDVVKAIGNSITVTIESPDPRGQMDGNFDWKCGATYAERMQNCPPRGHFIDYPNGPVTLDAEHALYLAQARGDTEVNWGFPNSNFEREKNQQKIVLAIREKALSTGTLTDITKVTALIDALGNNLRTNIETKEVRTVMSLAQDIKAESIQRLDLLDAKIMNGDGQPAAGLYNYSQLQAYIQKSLSSDPAIREGAVIVVYNGSDIAGAAQVVSDRLEKSGLTVLDPGNSPSKTDGTYEVFDITKTKPATKEKLEKFLTTTVKTTDPPFPVTGVDFVVIVGGSVDLKQ